MIKAKRYYASGTQFRYSVLPSQHPRQFRGERRIWFWRAVISGAVFFPAIYLLLYFGAFNWIYDLFG